MRPKHAGALTNPLNPHPLSQHFRDDDAAVGLLLVFEAGDHRSRDRDGGAVLGVRAADLFDFAFG